MTLEIAYLLTLIVVTLVLFATEVFSIDVVGLLLLLPLTLIVFAFCMALIPVLWPF